MKKNLKKQAVKKRLIKKEMANLLTRVVSQFDTLIPFLAVSHEDVFKLIKKREEYLVS